MTDMRTIVFFVLLASAATASAQIYRWTDAQGRVNFSNTAPPQGVKSTIVDPDAKEGPPSAESTECYSIRCQGERMEEPLAWVAAGQEALRQGETSGHLFTALPA